MIFLIDLTWISYNLDFHVWFVMLVMLYIASLPVSPVQNNSPNIWYILGCTVHVKTPPYPWGCQFIPSPNRDGWTIMFRCQWCLTKYLVSHAHSHICACTHKDIHILVFNFGQITNWHALTLSIIKQLWCPWAGNKFIQDFWTASSSSGIQKVSIASYSMFLILFYIYNLVIFRP